MNDRKKLLLKVIRNKEICWVHLCYVSKKVYDNFFRVTGCEKNEFGAYLSKWAREDFKITLSMATYEDMLKLEKLVEDRYKYEYSELYSGEAQETIRVTGWLRRWLTYHMKLEVLLNE